MISISIINFFPVRCTGVNPSTTHADKFDLIICGIYFCKVIQTHLFKHIYLLREMLFTAKKNFEK